MIPQTTEQDYRSSLDAAISSIEGRWKAPIIATLAQHGRPLRFNQLLSMIPGISPRLLTVQLRDLEKDAIVEREVVSVVPKKVQYCLTDRGLSLIPIFDQLAEWDMLGRYRDMYGFESDTSSSEGGLNA